MAVKHSVTHNHILRRAETPSYLTKCTSPQKTRDRQDRQCLKARCPKSTR
jgi:hypothetical protein